MTKREMAAVCDHTLLKATAQPKEIEKLCAEALEAGAASVCVNTCYVPMCADRLRGTGVKVCCVVGFPLGAMSTGAKALETADAIAKGAQEVDMVINVGMLKAGQVDYVKRDIVGVVAASKEAAVKVIIETCYLTDEEKLLACKLALDAGASFVKTSTGFGTGGATIQDVALMKKAVAGKAKVKASGGIRTKEDAEKMLEAGADRIGTGSMLSILEGFSE